MTEFPALPNLVDLNFVRGTLRNLAGIERLSLNTLTLSYIPKLISCKELLKLSAVLRRLQFDHCPNVGDFIALAEMEMLEKFMLRSSGSVPSLQFIKQMKSLAFFSFGARMLLTEIFRGYRVLNMQVSTTSVTTLIDSRILRGSVLAGIDQ